MLFSLKLEEQTKMEIEVTITPGSKKRGVKKNSEKNYEVNVKSLPKNNRANEEMLCLLREYFKKDERQIKIIKGHQRRKKILLIKDENRHKV